MVRKALIALIAALIALCLCACAGTSPALPENLERASVVYVVDGDTICVQRDAVQGPEKVRLIGIDAPESVASQQYLDATGKENTQEGVDASAYLKGMLPPGTVIYLEQDKSDTDRYGRLLRYAWLDEPKTGSEEEIKSLMVNAMLVSSGHAVPKEYKPDTKYSRIFGKLYSGVSR